MDCAPGWPNSRRCSTNARPKPIGSIASSTCSRPTTGSRSARCTSSWTQLELDIAEAELGELSKNGGRRRRPGRAPAPSPVPPESAPRFTSDAVRKLFRDVAKAIHPDFADDEHTRDRRHALMIEANRAYALRDAEQLRRILEVWERSAEAVQGSDPEATRLRLERRLAQIEEHLDTVRSRSGGVAGLAVVRAEDHGGQGRRPGTRISWRTWSSA